jgi:hypothetical protein
MSALKSDLKRARSWLHKAAVLGWIRSFSQAGVENLAARRQPVQHEVVTHLLGTNRYLPIRKGDHPLTRLAHIVFAAAGSVIEVVIAICIVLRR